MVTGWSMAVTMFSRSASMTIFSNEVNRPPSNQPAPWSRRFTPPMTAPHTAMVLSVADWLSTLLEAFTLDDR